MAISDATPASEHYTTLEVARLLGMAVRSVQLMVDRGELEAWKTPGGHRRISRHSVQAWMAARQGASRPAPLDETSSARSAPPAPASPRARVLLIEDSAHYQNLVSLLVRQQFPQVDLRAVDDGIAGLALYGQWQPQILIVDVLLPGIDGATLITSLRSHPQFAQSQLIVITALDEDQRGPYAFALSGVPVVHKPRLVMDLPPLLQHALAAQAPRAQDPA
ncbi:MAG: excisionase family DNA-binding protein [Caldimonas sp.]|uniref:excisionase family DNA-binding protein n=1 Tax=Caldimonas sp. TaxID=2838790 RepID=UPI003919EAEC